MCDYSLEIYASRPAREAEVYVTTRFSSGSIGLASPGDCETAVCVTYDTRLMLENIPSELQETIGVQAMEEVVFTRLEEGLHHDGVKFANGRAVPLHRLGSGVLASLVATQEPLRGEKARDAAKSVEPAE